MANIKSAKKRILVNETKAARNKAIKSKVKTAVKKVEAAVAAKDAETAKTALRAAIVEISKAGTKGVYQKNCFQKDFSSFQSCKQHCLIVLIELIKIEKTFASVRQMSFFVHNLIIINKKTFSYKKTLRVMQGVFL